MTGIKLKSHLGQEFGEAGIRLILFVVAMSLTMAVIYRLMNPGTRNTGWDEGASAGLPTVACDERNFFERVIKSPGSSANGLLDFKGGHLVAVDAGEWGGGIMFEAPEHKERKLIDENGHSLYRLRSGVVAITGLAHLSLNYGSVWRIHGPNPTDVVRIHQIAGKPLATWQNANGTVIIRARGGDHVLSPEGDLSDVNCGTN